MTYVIAKHVLHHILNTVMRWLDLHLDSETVFFSSEKYYKQYKHRRIHSKYQVGDDIYGKVLGIKISKWPGNISNRLLRRKSILIVFKCVYLFDKWLKCRHLSWKLEFLLYDKCDRKKIWNYECEDFRIRLSLNLQSNCHHKSRNIKYNNASTLKYHK